ncbi:hypothetical protein TeGR_g10193 [Tetraparma gracilis]|uniref:Right handed beta helix domain-containing protein n=1 Tax=Tetraparma gracilis TaxID=2962635 RepID=A0ABQ6N9D4_9STRA|nr:hypothetical protein TeGR_g10193 [Tetraparma gracilis]
MWRGLLLSCLLLSSAAAAGDILVFPSGDDSDPLTSSDLPGAISLARTLPAPVTISLPTSSPILLTSAIVLDSRDSGTSFISRSTTDSAVISGGVHLSSFTACPDASHLQCTAAPVNAQPRHLLIDDRRAPRAVGSDELLGYFTKPTADSYVLPAAAASDPVVQSWLASSGTAAPELVYTAKGSPWTESRCAVASTSLSSSGEVEVVMQQPCFSSVQNKPCSQGTSEPDHVENTHYTDLSPGQFFLDSSRNVIMYYPLPSETDMSAATAIMPTLEVLLSATSASDLSFTNITFAHATYARPNSPLGYVEQQSGALVDHPSNPPDCVDYEWIPTTSNLLFSGCTDVTLTGCTFLHLSAVAVEFSGGAHNNVVDACKFEDIGGAAVQIGHYDTYAETDASKQEQSNKVTNSLMERCAAELHGHAAVSVGYSMGTEISNNHISTVYYTGVSIGWGWSRELDTYASNNVVANNLIDGFKLQGSYPDASLGDGGGIYALGPQQNSTMTGNWLNNMGGGLGGGAFYPDEGSAYWKIDHNVFSNATLCSDDCEWLHIWNPSIHDISVSTCWTDTATQQNQGTDTTVEDIVVVDQGTPREDWPEAAQDVMNNAGPPKDAWFYDE